MSPPVGKYSPPSDSEKYHLLTEDDSEIVITDAGYSRFAVDASRTISHRKDCKKHWLPLIFFIVAVNILSGLAGFYIGQARVVCVAGDFTSSNEDTPWGAVYSSIQC